MKSSTILIVLFLSTFVMGCQKSDSSKVSEQKTESTDSMQVNDNEWKSKLTQEEYHILREKGTERPFTGKYWNLFEDGSYRCAGCGAILFSSSEKFESGCGWPSFWEVADSNAIKITKDYSHGMIRDEVTCAKCGGHLGHVFDDGPKPTGQRYCINSASLRFEKKAK